MTEILLLLAGFAGGALNSLAGGGSFIVFPALLFAGVPPVLANASNTYAALPGYVSGAIGYWKAMAEHRHRLLVFGAIALIGGYLGAELLLVVPDAVFAMVVPWLMLFAVVLFAFGANVNRWLARTIKPSRASRTTGAVVLFAMLALVCVYGGFFNAGLGILLLAYLASAGMSDIHAMNGMKLTISSLVALVAVVRFAISGAIDWYFGSIALIGVVAGGYLAARLAHHIPTKLIRGAVIVYGAGMTFYFFIAAYSAA
ncbi:UPF0721 transmembrane protein [Devosia pacifica]|uniref:Probable membrane transporter protein n=1 Tax=Devosia pacifica TaxID=1335967 RepID=A0A918SCC3_9HYPH|nr:sulfite exporter TauE/SafE family protein [Devosia pacifica]GHA35438.1 UPF0721 transmembrane protein [Devosia pacifica]